MSGRPIKRTLRDPERHAIRRYEHAPLLGRWPCGDFTDAGQTPRAGS